MISRAERCALAGALILVLLQGVASALPQLGAVLEYQLAALGAQPWRLLTGHWVHINWVHALINAAAWFIVARLFGQELTPARQVLVVLGAGVAISAGLALVYPQIDWYRGFSGVLHALFFAGATAWLTRTLTVRESRNLGALWLPGALALGGWVKVQSIFGELHSGYSRLTAGMSVDARPVLALSRHILIGSFEESGAGRRNFSTKRW